MMRSAPYETLREEEDEEEEETKKRRPEPGVASAATPAHSPFAPPTCASPADVGFASRPVLLLPHQQQQQLWQQQQQLQQYPPALPQLLPSQVMAGVNMGSHGEQWPQALPLQLHYLCSWTSPPPPPLPPLQDQRSQPPLPPSQQQQQSQLPQQWQPSLTSVSPLGAVQYVPHADGLCATPSGIQMKEMDDAAVRQHQQVQPTPPPSQPPSYFVWSLVSFLFFCAPLGTAAMVASLLVRQAAAFAGSAGEARRASLVAWRLNAAATVLGPIIWIAYFVMSVRVFMLSSGGGSA